MDVISSIGFGEAFGDIKADADLNDFIGSSEKGLIFLTYSAAFGLTPILQWSLLAPSLHPSEKENSGFGKMMAIARKLIDSRLKRDATKHSDMLAAWVRHGLTKDEIFSEAMFGIVAGSDTTAAAIRCIMLYLMSHPRVYRKLQAEIDTTAANFPGIIPDATARHLPYLQSVIREGLRMHPPATDVVPKKVPKGGDTVTIEGKRLFLPGGTNICYDAWGVHHNKHVFGENADLFIPERWLVDENDDANREKLKAMRRTTEMIFGYGKYQCLGKPVAWIDIGKVLFEVSRFSLFNPLTFVFPLISKLVSSSFRLVPGEPRESMAGKELLRPFRA